MNKERIQLEKLPARLHMININESTTTECFGKLPQNGKTRKNKHTHTDRVTLMLLQHEVPEGDVEGKGLKLCFHNISGIRYVYF